jgi:Ca2+-binding EF-hand superfamily protein
VTILYPVFRIFDDDGNRKIEQEEFYWGMRDMQVEITKREAQLLLDSFDLDNDGTVNFDEFLIGIRGDPSPARKKYIHKAFQKFDKDGNGVITAADLKGVYNCSMHPKVQSGELTEDDVFVDFLKNFGDKNGDGKITRQEWDDYYAAVSSSIDNDDHFIMCIKRAYSLD